jgi:hypothetical protein
MWPNFFPFEQNLSQYIHFFFFALGEVSMFNLFVKNIIYWNFITLLSIYNFDKTCLTTFLNAILVLI